MDPIAHNVRQLRKLRGVTQAELAKAAGTTQYTVSEIELAHREPHPATLRKLANALDVRVADFYREPATPQDGQQGQQLTAGVSIDLRWRVFSNFEDATRAVLEEAVTEDERRRAAAKMRRSIDRQLEAIVR